MADTRESWKRFIPKDLPKTDRRSDYLKAKAFVGGGVVNTCPFGCEDHALDDRGLCHHMIGYSLGEREGERPTKFVPLKYQRHLDGTVMYDTVITDGNDVQAILPSDVLVQITVNSFVYRKNAPKDRPAVPKHKIPEKMYTVLGVQREDGTITPATPADLQPKKPAPKKRTQKKKEPEAEMQPA